MVKETPGLTKRLLAEHVSRGELHGIVDILADAIKKLATRLDVVEKRGLKFVGSWQRSVDYARGAVCLHAGSAWCCLSDAPAGTVPGKSVDHWQLFSKQAESAELRSLDLRLEAEVRKAKEAAGEAAGALARVAAQSAAAAEAAAKTRKTVEVTRVVRHDAQGRILEFEKSVQERTDP